MKTLVVFAAMMFAAMAKPLGEQVVHVRQDSLGNYDLSYGVSGHSRVEQHSHRAVPVVSRVALLPEEHAVLTARDTPEVTLAKVEHLNIHRAAELSHLVSNVEVPTVVEVAETPVFRSHVNTIPIALTSDVVKVASPHVSTIVAPETRHIVVV